MVHVNEFKLVPRLYQVIVMTVYGSELLDFPTALSCVDVFFARSFLIRMRFLRRYYSLFLLFIFYLQALRYKSGLSFIYAVCFALFSQECHELKKTTPQVFQLIPIFYLNLIIAKASRLAKIHLISLKVTCDRNT